METAVTFIALGALLLIGMLADEAGHRTRFPRVTLLILCGLAVGPATLDLLPHVLTQLYEPLSILALSMVAFLLGGKLSKLHFENSGGTVATVSITAVAATAVLVGGGLVLFGYPPALALILAALATATDPAATNDVVRQYNAKGPFSDTLAGIVALDDVWGVVVFALCLMAAQALFGTGNLDALYHAAWDIGGAIALGITIGIPAGYLSGRLRTGDPTLSEALGIVFLTAGSALWLDVSFLLAGVACGATVINSGRHHSKPFHEIEHIEWPFMIFFFVLAGASLEPANLLQLGGLGLAYVALRTLGRLAGGWLGGKLHPDPAFPKSYLFGLALLPQAGIAVGMALVAAEALPHLRLEILTIAIGSTIVFELIGPMLTAHALRKANEIGR